MLLAAALALLVAASATGAHPQPYRTDETIGASFTAGPVSTMLDPGAAAGERNPRVLVPVVSSEVRARATVLDERGAGVSGVGVTGTLTLTEATVTLAFVEIAPGVYESQRVAYRGGTATLRVAYDFNGDLRADHEATRVYRPLF